MAIKIKLEKDGFIKDGVVGYSFTTALFNLWVPAFRLDFNAFVFFLGIYVFKEFLLDFLKLYMKINSKTIESFSFISIVLLAIPSFIAFFYNQYYTKKLLSDGWKPLKNDEYSRVILESYHYLDYTDTNLINDDKIEQYKEFVNKAQREEKKKTFLFILFAISIIAYYYFFN